MATDLERLTITIEANTRSYERAMLRLQAQTEKAIRASSGEFKKLNSSLDAASRAAGNLAKGFFAFQTIKRATGFIRDAITELAELQDTADKLGIGTKRLQQLQYQAEQTGTSFEGLKTGLDTFLKRLSESRQGQGELAKLFGAQATPIDPKKFKDINEALTTFIDLIGHGADEAARLQISAAGFGKAFGPEGALMFAGGAAEAKKFADQLENRIFTPQQLRAAAKFDDTLEKIERRANVLSKGFLVDFLDEIVRSANLIQEEGFVKFFRDPLGKGVTEASKAGERLADAFEQGFSNKDKVLEAALVERAKRSGGDLIAKPKTGETDFTILPPDPEKIQEAKGALRELLQTRYEHIKIVTDETQKVQEFIAELEREYEILGKTNVEQRISNELHQAGAFATGEDRKRIEQLVRNIEAREKLIEHLDEFRDAAGSALDAFVQSIANAEGPLNAMKAALKDILQTIIQIAERAFITKLFGEFGTSALGGFNVPSLSLGGSGGGPAAAAGGGGQQVSVHVTASPLFDVQIRQSEARSVARGPAAARDNQRRFAVP